MASIRQLPSGRFNVQVRRKNAKPLTGSFDTLEAAEQWAREREKEVTVLPPPKAEENPMAFLALGKRYCNTVLKGRPSRSITLYRVERIAPHLPEDVRAITKFDVNRY